MSLTSRWERSWTGVRKKHVILIMITNKTLEELDDICRGDVSILREGRVDLKINLYDR